jgi:two-component system chemotaxis response regulator CheY
MTTRLHVLAVDDDPAIREFLEMLLISEGYEVTTAPNGAAAIRLLDLVMPAVILLDMRMPIMDGWQFLELYRRRPGVKAPIVVLTAAQDDARRAAEAGADGYVAKPFAIDAVLHAIERSVPQARCRPQT